MLKTSYSKGCDSQPTLNEVLTNNDVTFPSRLSPDHTRPCSKDAGAVPREPRVSSSPGCGAGAGSALHGPIQLAGGRSPASAPNSSEMGGADNHKVFNGSGAPLAGQALSKPDREEGSCLTRSRDGGVTTCQTAVSAAQTWPYTEFHPSPVCSVLQ